MPADATIHDDETPEGRPATDADITSILAGLTAADGTSYLDIFDATDDD